MASTTFRKCDQCGTYYPEEEMYMHGCIGGSERPDVLCIGCNKTSLIPGLPFSYADYAGESRHPVAH